ncbi:MAG: SAM-dependent methyltransferase, partial [Oscillospiraceae bacterium]|nr:SAM-dependent methyltransferase [Oscillospiraceae bacterium]
AGEEWGFSNLMTSASLAAIGRIGGPRCCKRDSYLAIETTVDFVYKNFGIKMEKHKIICEHYEKNNQCIKTCCPFYPFEK